MSIDTSQAKAISHKDGPAIVLAGPGSGKTTVITHRIRHMIRTHGISPERILVITFSRAAAQEMKERFYKLTDGEAAPVTFGTFHAVFFQILKHAYGYTAANIIREDIRTQFMRERIHRLRLECEDEADLIQGIFGEISLIKNGDQQLSQFESAHLETSVFCSIYHAYEEFLQKNRYLDFDDMLLYTKELFEQRPDILAAWQKKFSYLLIDEFQDINPLQYAIVRMLALPENNLFIVGDDDQSIYHFRGARPEIMLHFTQDYPDAQTIILATNYRSGTHIVSMAKRLISHNHVRFDKDIHAHAADGLPPMIRQFETQKTQNQFVIATIQTLHDKERIPYREMAILFRTNAQPALIIQQLLSCNLPFVSREYVPNPFEHWVAKDILSYLRLAHGERTRTLFLRVMNRPKRYLSRESLPYDQVSFAVWKDYYKDQHWILQRLKKLEADLDVLQRLRPYSAIHYIRKAMDYDAFLKEFAVTHKVPVDDLLEILEKLSEDARDYLSYSAWLAHINRQKADWQEQFASNTEETDGIRLCTLHASKGLEFDTVFIVDANETLMPYKKAVMPDELEEERRMFYVGMTRAKRRLYLLSSGQVLNKKMQPSRFLSECLAAK